MVNVNASSTVVAHQLPVTLRTGNALAERVCAHVLSSIRSGKLAPGAKITERRVAKELEMSPVPVREAMARLEHEGWVERIPNRGVFVKRVSLDDLGHLYEMREILEVAALAKFAPSVTAAQLAQLYEAVERKEEGVSTHDVLMAEEADMQFHRLVVQFAGNPRLEFMFESVLLQASGCLFRWAEDFPFFIKQVRKQLRGADHRQIYEALAAGNVAKAEKLLREHLRLGYRTMVGVQTLMETLSDESGS